MDNEDGKGYYEPYYEPYSYPPFSYNYYGSSHLQQFPHYECAPIRVSPETPVGETDSVPSSPHSVSEASDEDCVEVEVSFSSFAIWWIMKNLLYY